MALKQLPNGTWATEQNYDATLASVMQTMGNPGAAPPQAPASYASYEEIPTGLDAPQPPPPAPLTLNTADNDTPPPADPFAGYSWHQGGTLTMRAPNNPDGTPGRVEAFPTGDANGGLNREIDVNARNGWVPLNEKGNAYTVREHQGGTMFHDPDRDQWMPINVLTGGGWLDAQKAEMPNFFATTGKLAPPTSSPRPPKTGVFNQQPRQDVPNDPGGGGGGPDVDGDTDLGPIRNARGPGGAGGIGELTDLFPTFETPGIDKTQLGALPTVNREYGPEFDNKYNEYLKAQSAVTGGYYDFDPTKMEAAQIDPTKVPNVTAQTPQMFEALQQLLSGEGFDSATRGRMHAMANDDIARSGAAQRGASRLSAEQAGLAGSPAAMAMEGQSMRRQGDEQNRASQEIEVQNAMVGNQNRVTGAGMELNRQSTGAAQANAVALQNAANLLTSMRDNTNNVQQTNMVNTQNDVGRQMTQAGQKASTFDQGSQAYNQSALNRGSQADFWNALQTVSRQSEQASMDRDADKFNAGNKMTRYGWDTGNLVNLANMTGANNLYSMSNNLSPGTGTTSGTGTALADLARMWFTPKPAGATA